MSTSSSSDTTFLYLVRHGATEANFQKPPILQGKGMDLTLNELGRKQASAAGRFLSEFSIDHVYSSPLLRAMETGRAIAEPNGHTVHPIPELVEADVGEWEEKDWGTIMRDFPNEYAAFMEDPGRNPYRGGESYGDVQRRVQPVIADLFERHEGQSIVVVAHNVVNRVYLAALLGLDLKFAKGIRQTNTGVNVIRHRNGETELMTLNAHFHLNGIEAT